MRSRERRRLRRPGAMATERGLRLRSLDGGLHLRAAWTRSRRDGFQPLPAWLVEKLEDYAAADRATLVYADAYACSPTQAEPPGGRLLYVPTHTAGALDKDLRAPGTEKRNVEGKADFQSLRVTHVPMLGEAGGTITDLQGLARHATPQVTANVYWRTREERLTSLAEAIGSVVGSEPNGSPSMEPAVQAETDDPKPLPVNEIGWWRRRESNPRPKALPLEPLRT